MIIILKRINEGLNVLNDDFVIMIFDEGEDLLINNYGSEIDFIDGFVKVVVSIIKGNVTEDYLSYFEEKGYFKGLLGYLIKLRNSRNRGEYIHPLLTKYYIR